MYKTRIFLLLLISFVLVDPSKVEAASASYTISPSGGNFTVGSTIKAVVGLNANGIATNAGEGTITFTTDTLKAVNVTQGGVFGLWQTSPVINQGKIPFAAGRTTNFSGSGTLLTVTLQAIKAGTASITIEGGDILAADGNGTSVYGGTKSAQWRITEASKESALPPLPEVSSPTNPSQESWYNTTSTVLEWKKPQNTTELAYTVDLNPLTEPVTIVPFTESLTLNNLGEGTYYAHIRFKNQSGWGQTAHFKIQNDVTEPSGLSIELVDGPVTYQKRPRIKVKSEDTPSGIALEEISIDNDPKIAIIPDQDGYIDLTRKETGDHTVTYTVTDFAGNKASTQTKYTIKPEPTDPSLLKNYLIITLTLLALLLLAYIFKLRRKIKVQEVQR